MRPFRLTSAPAALLTIVLLLAPTARAEGPAESPADPSADAPSAQRVEAAKARAWDRPFLIFNAMFPTKDRPLAARTFAALAEARATFCWCNDERGTVPGIKMAQAAVAARAAGAIVLLDYERDPIDVRSQPAAAVGKTVGMYLSRIADLRRADAALRVGFYAVLPIRDYWTPVHLGGAEAIADGAWWKPRKLADATAVQAAWADANAQLAPLAAAVDYVAPSLYLFGNEPGPNEAYWRGNLAQARRYGKPVYAVVHSNYVGSYGGTHFGQAIPAEVIQPLIDGCRPPQGNPGNTGRAWRTGSAGHARRPRPTGAAARCAPSVPAPSGESERPRRSGRCGPNVAPLPASPPTWFATPRGRPDAWTSAGEPPPGPRSPPAPRRSRASRRTTNRPPPRPGGCAG